MSQESAPLYEAYYAHKQMLPQVEKHEDYTVVSFDGKGVPMIKTEAAKIKARLGKGEKKRNYPGRLRAPMSSAFTACLGKG